ncbi:MAG: HD domain-containing protein [Bacillota bacterium]
MAGRDARSNWNSQEQALLDEALLLAVRAHRGQKDKGGAPYILHPLRVMLSLGEPSEMVAAVLHDAIEDGNVSAEQLRGKGFPEEVVRALDALTRRPGEDYGEYLVRVKANPLALRVKVADLRDNLDESRIPDRTEEDLRRWEKYRRALQELEC